MKKLNLEKLKLAAADVLQRSQMGTIYWGSGGSTNCQWVCTRDGGEPFSLWDCSGDPTKICEVNGHCSGQD
ncbi:hypothetical protein [Cyclobacterium roseum]|uniref:hypothetical protein n=1 Tax=Cyclobacterium roseum TaxID=2666137 RepID=UPI001391F8D1|nr:hypothetical protein [Cyclobacterium roseum]